MRRLNLSKIMDSVQLDTIDETLKPDIGIFPNHSLDSTLVLKCNVSHTSTGKFLWSLNGSLIENSKIYFQTDAFLYIRNLTADDKYNFYTCKESESELKSNPYSIQTWIDHFITKATTLTEDMTGSFLCCSLFRLMLLLHNLL
ncbi:hypothetical protein ACJMK2_025711 [Sinanodonta woodiana]|uniref:Ig-like domain-containing protein n=1 Tax=Sinanodonta woodiana TaxID=1069815 RepID=A0ABD3XHD0_SINWO